MRTQTSCVQFYIATITQCLKTTQPLCFILPKVWKPAKVLESMYYTSIISQLCQSTHCLNSYFLFFTGFLGPKRISKVFGIEKVVWMRTSIFKVKNISKLNCLCELEIKVYSTSKSGDFQV